ncbi:hypothetical protein PIECOFPK_02107 [Mycovorax composti]|jgi:Fibronectin type III domain.
MVVCSYGCTKTIEKERTSLETSRLFSPTKLTATVVNRTSVRLSWGQVGKAGTYTIEIYESSSGTDFSGAPFRVVEGVTLDQVPYTVSGLDGETRYVVRVKAVGEGVEDSKWVSATFTTDAEQIFYPVDLNEIEPTSVVLRWPAGEAATQIVLIPGNITHSVTAEEVSAGAATITGLVGETTYTARLLNGTKTRGTITFTTPIDLGGAIQVTPDDDLTNILQNASDGDVFALMPGTYVAQDIFISKSISIKGAKPAEKPVLKGVVLRISNGAGLQLKDLIIDGTGALDGNQFLVYNDDMNTAYGDLKVEDCTIFNYVKGVMYVNKKAWILSVLYRNNIIYNIECSGGDFIDFRNGLSSTFTFVNNTVYNSAAARDIFRMDAGGSTNFPSVTSVIDIQNNTFYNIAKSSSNRMLYIRLASNQITFSKNLIVNSEGYYSNQAATNIVARSNNNYYNAPNFTNSSVANAKNDPGPYTTLNPGFVNPDAGDFTVTNLDLKIAGVGDPRWLQ